MTLIQVIRRDPESSLSCCCCDWWKHSDPLLVLQRPTSPPTVGSFPSAFLCLSATLFDCPRSSFSSWVPFFVCHFIFPPCSLSLSNLLSHESRVTSFSVFVQLCWKTVLPHAPSTEFPLTVSPKMKEGGGLYSATSKLNYKRIIWQCKIQKEVP